LVTLHHRLKAVKW